MKRESMICINCIKFESAVELPNGSKGMASCHLWPKLQIFSEGDLGGRSISPKSHWCAQGEWKETIPGFTNKASVYWGMSDEDGYVHPIYDGSWSDD